MSTYYKENTNRENTNSNKNTQKKIVSYAAIGKAYLQSVKTPMISFKGIMYKYNGTKYVEVKNPRAKIRKFLVLNKLQDSTAFTNNVLDALVDLLDQEHESMPFMIGNQDHVEYIAFKNCLYDIETDRTFEHTERWVSKHCLDYNYDKSATCPQWFEFLDQCFDGDEQRIKLLQQWFGYCLTSDISQHKFLVAVGPPRCGKSTTQRILKHILGEDATTAYKMHALANSFGFLRLVGKNVAFIGEVNLAGSRDKNQIVETMNSIVGGDAQPIELKHSNTCDTVTLPTKFHICCNEIPTFLDPSGAYASRLMILNYDNSFFGREDRDLESKLKTECDGICQWALNGMRDLRQTKRFVEVDRAANDFTDVMRTDSPVMAFLIEHCIVNKAIEPGNKGYTLVDDDVSVAKIEFNEAFNEYCKNHDLHLRDNIYIGKNIKSAIPKINNEKKIQFCGKRVNAYGGIDLKVKKDAYKTF